MKQFIMLILSGITTSVYSQDFDSLSLAISNLAGNYIDKINYRISLAESRVSNSTEKYLKKLQRQEEKIIRHISKTGSSAAYTLAKAKQSFSETIREIKSKTEPLSWITKVRGGEYNVYLDSLVTSLNFLKQYKEMANKVKEPLKDIQQLKDRLQQAEQLKTYIAEKKEQLKQSLTRYTNIPKNLQKHFEKLSKTAYYYSAQVKEIKEILKQPKRVEQQAFSLLNKLPAFQNFMKENSKLAQLFSIPGSMHTVPPLAGLQAVTSVQAMVAQRVSMGGGDAMLQVQQNLSLAHALLNEVKEKFSKAGGSSNDIEMPDFRPNGQKTKSLLKRLEVGSNLQTQKAGRFFPVTSDIGLSVGYKLNDKSIIGIGASCKIGWGRGFSNIHITTQGIGLRSFIDYSIKKSIFISGGYEQNYKTAFTFLEPLKDYNAWLKSGLIGITKKYKISKKIRGSLQLLWDFLSYSQIPRTQPVVYRVGYTLK